jgi:predicted Zn-dependent protease
MSGFFHSLGYNLGRVLGPKVREANWIFRSLTGTEAEAIRAETAVGRDLAQSFARQFEACPDRDVRDFLADLGTCLAGRLTNRHRRFCVSVVQAPEINAFALPGGFIFLTQSLVEFCDRDRHALAFILGHEMGHVVRRHAIDRLMANTALRAAFSVAPVRGLARLPLAGLATTVFQQSYAQDQELEADRFGARLARSAGFDPDAAIRVLEKLDSKSEDIGVPGSYFASHPPLTVRVQNLQRWLRE